MKNMNEEILLAFIIAIFCFVIICIIALIDFIIFPFYAVKGEHRVTITAVEQNKINTNVYTKTGEDSSQEDVYCIHNSRITDDMFIFLKKKARAGDQYILKFDQEHRLLPWECRDVIE